MSLATSAFLLAFFVGIAFWRLHPVLLMIAGAVSLMMGCYAADLVNAGTTNELSITISLSLFVLWLTCWSLAFWAMFRPLKGNHNG